MAKRIAGLVPISRSRLAAALLTLDFLIDTIQLSRSGADLLEPLLFAAIVQANLGPLRQDRELQRRYGDAGAALPDEYRRPISNAALANSLGLPIETVRRRVKAMAEKGLSVLTPIGVYAPQSAIGSAAHAAIQQARLMRLQQFHDDLRGVGFLAPTDALPRPLPRALFRTVNSALSQYMLRSCDRLVRLGGAVTDGYVLLGLCAENCRDLGRDQGLTLAPCRASHLAHRLELAEETVRRRLAALRKRGRASQLDKTWLVAPPRPEVIARMVADNEADLLRLFERLREIARLADP